MPSAATGTAKSCAWRTVAARISKNSSRLVQEMHRKRRRSSSGTDPSRAWARTRKLKSSCDSSRLKYRDGSNRASSARGSGMAGKGGGVLDRTPEPVRSEEHTSELLLLMRITYAVVCLKKKITQTNNNINDTEITPINEKEWRCLT